MSSQFYHKLSLMRNLNEDLLKEIRSPTDQLASRGDSAVSTFWVDIGKNLIK